VQVRIEESLAAFAPAEWDALTGGREPFLSHAFLNALETQGCLGQEFGWFPRHIALRDASGELIAAAPAYIKTNSYGEFVFDWSWASAYRQYGRRYYPKLVVSVPYTPASGPRLLIRPGPSADAADELRDRMIEAAIEYAQAQGLSGVHWLFTDPADTARLQAAGLSLRLGCQYHWSNAGYASFDAFLARFTSRQRKKVKRERRRVEEADVRVRMLHGDEIDEAMWPLLHRYYVETFEKKAGIPTLSLGFFRSTARSLGRQLVVALAEHGDRPVAAAINYRSEDTLYGRYWGCEQDFHSLHFETCYYSGIEYCIEQGLQRFEPGAQGEHKISRGFLPTETWSAHWVADEAFRGVIADFCRREEEAMRTMCSELMTHAPFREDSAADA
jgi:predicted N-acyltransferase